MLMQQSQVRKWFIESKTKAYIQRKVGWSDPESGSRIKAQDDRIAVQMVV